MCRICKTWFQSRGLALRLHIELAWRESQLCSLEIAVFLIASRSSCTRRWLVFSTPRLNRPPVSHCLRCTLSADSLTSVSWFPDQCHPGLYSRISLPTLPQETCWSSGVYLRDTDTLPSQRPAGMKYITSSVFRRAIEIPTDNQIKTSSELFTANNSENKRIHEARK